MERARVVLTVVLGVAMVMAALAGCAGTDVKSISRSWEVDEDTGKRILISEEKIRGRTGAIAAKQELGGLNIESNADSEGGWKVVLKGDSSGADSTGVALGFADLGVQVAALFTPSQLIVFNQALDRGASAEELAMLIQRASAATEPAMELDSLND